MSNVSALRATISLCLALVCTVSSAQSNRNEELVPPENASQ